MSLFITELRRLGKRRLTRYAALLGLLTLVAIAAGTFVTNEKIGPAQIAAAERQAEAAYQENLVFSEQFRKECEQAKAAGTANRDQFPENCEDIQPPPREGFEAQWYLPSSFNFRDGFGGTLLPFAGVLGLIAFIVGASYVGAEWSTGGMTNLLLWRPQRLKVLLTKLGALLTGVLAVTVGSALLWTAAFWAIGTYRGSTEKMTAGVWKSFALAELRGTLLVLAAALIGFALASLGRHTAMALGGAIAVGVAQFGIGIAAAMAGVRFIEVWLLPTYAAAWMNSKITLQDWNACQASYTGECEPATMDLTWQHAGLLLAAGVLLTLGAAMWTMRRRDVT